MLAGRFLCDSCQEILSCQELRLCSGCSDILCSMCQFSKCDGGTSNDIFHKTRKLEGITNKSHAKVHDRNHGLCYFEAIFSLYYSVAAVDVFSCLAIHSILYHVLYYSCYR